MMRITSHLLLLIALLGVFIDPSNGMDKAKKFWKKTKKAVGIGSRDDYYGQGGRYQEWSAKKEKKRRGKLGDEAQDSSAWNYGRMSEALEETPAAEVEEEEVITEQDEETETGTKDETHTDVQKKKKKNLFCTHKCYLVKVTEMRWKRI